MCHEWYITHEHTVYLSYTSKTKTSHPKKKHRCPKLIHSVQKLTKIHTPYLTNKILNNPGNSCTIQPKNHNYIFQNHWYTSRFETYLQIRPNTRYTALFSSAAEATQISRFDKYFQNISTQKNLQILNTNQ